MVNMIRHRMFFGLKWVIGELTGTVTDIAFTAFCQHEVDTRFDAYTVYDANGTWKGVPEGTKVLEIMIPDSELGLDNFSSSVQAIAEAYKEAFFQDCVMVEVQPVECSFI